MEHILDRAKSLGIKFDEEEKEELEHLAELQELLGDAERQRDGLREAGEDTTVHDRVIAKTWDEIQVLLTKLR